MPRPSGGRGPAWLEGDEMIAAIYGRKSTNRGDRKRINGRKVWWVRVNYRGLNASRVCESKEAAKDAEAARRESLRTGEAGRAHAHALGRAPPSPPGDGAPGAGDHPVAPGEGWRAVRDSERGRLEGPPGAAQGSRQGLSLPEPRGRALHNARFTAPIVMQLGGWKTEKMMRRYAAVTDARLCAAAEAVSGAPLTLVPGRLPVATR